ncbi:MAG: T9SS type A sorting domain-containing protein [Bacteroidota bacterium]
MKKIYLLVLLFFVCNAAFATRYFPNSISTPAGATATYCDGQMNVAYTATVTMCPLTTGGGAATNTITARWFWNGTLVYIDPVTYTPSSAADYVLSLPAGTFTLTPPGTYSLSGPVPGSGLYVRLNWNSAAPAGCTMTGNGPMFGTPLTINVTAPPPAIAGTPNVCEGRTTTLSNTTAGGTWASSNTAVATVATTGVVTGLLAGTSIISYTVGGCVVTATVTVNGFPAAITGLDEVCQGRTITLANTTAGGTWASSNTGVATIGSGTGVVTGVSAGGSVISYIVAGCEATTTIGVNGSPAAITPATGVGVCIGSTATLSNSTLGGTWSTASAAASVSGGGVVTGISAGTVTITYTLTATGCYVTKEVTVNPDPAAIAGTPEVCEGSTATLADATPAGTWSSSSPAIATVNSSGVLSGIAMGTARISYTLSTGCYDTITVSVGRLPGPVTGPDSLCSGGSMVTLVDTVAGGTWTSSSTAVATVAATGVVTSVSDGVVDISYTTPGCPAATHTLTVSPQPAAITGSLTACVGAPSSLFNTTPGGTWSSADISRATVGPTSGVVTGVSMGTTLISYIAPGGCFITAAVTVNPLGPVLGDDSVCAGAATYLTNIAGGGTWASGNPAIAGVTSATGVVTGITTGISYIVYTLPTGCMDSILVTVLPPLPAISGPLQVCRGSVTALANASAGGTWSSSNLFVATIGAATGVVTALVPDTVRITYTKPHNCVVSALMTVNATPAPTVTHNTSAGTLTTGTGYATYQWYDSTNGIIPGANTATLTLPAYGSYFYVIVTDGSGCTGRAGMRIHVVGIDNVAASQVQVYPNPASDIVHISAPVTIRATVTGMDGRILLAKDNAATLDISSLANGMYILAVYNGQGEMIKVTKLVKQ